MRYTNDDFNQFYSDGIAFLPDNNISSIQNSKVNSEIDAMVANAELSGVDLLDPYAMSGFLDDIMSKVKSIGNTITGGKDVTITTDKGITTVGPSGVAYVSTTPQSTTAIAQSNTQQLTNYLKNPYVIAGLVGLPLLIYILNKRKNKK